MGVVLSQEFITRMGVKPLDENNNQKNKKMRRKSNSFGRDLSRAGSRRGRQSVGGGVEEGGDVQSVQSVRKYHYAEVMLALIKRRYDYSSSSHKGAGTDAL